MSVSLIFLVALVSAAVAGTRDYPREIVNTARTVTGSKPFPSYDPSRLMRLYDQRNEVELQMFDTINEAALRRDRNLGHELDIYGSSLGGIPSLHGKQPGSNDPLRAPAVRTTHSASV